MAILKNRSLKKSLNEQAVKNTQITKGTSKEQKVIKEGVPNDHSRKHLTNAPTIGVSVGTTLNMGDYESLRVDVWLTDSVQEGETFETAYSRVTQVVDKTLQDIVCQYK